jgi:hypothetical protein
VLRIPQLLGRLPKPPQEKPNLSLRAPWFVPQRQGWRIRSLAFFIREQCAQLYGAANDAAGMRVFGLEPAKVFKKTIHVVTSFRS